MERHTIKAVTIAVDKDTSRRWDIIDSLDEPCDWDILSFLIQYLVDKDVGFIIEVECEEKTIFWEFTDIRT